MYGDNELPGYELKEEADEILGTYAHSLCSLSLFPQRSENYVVA